MLAQEKMGNGENKAISDKSGSQPSGKHPSLRVKAKLKDRKYALLKRLMLFGLKPSLRMAALKMLMCKKKKLALCDLNTDDVEGKRKVMFIETCLCILSGIHD